MNLTRDGVGSAVERVEDVREFGRRDADTVIADGDPDLGPAALPAVLDLDADPAIAPAVLDGVGDQILDGRAQRRRIADDCRRVGNEIALNGDLLGPEER